MALALRSFVRRIMRAEPDIARTAALQAARAGGDAVTAECQSVVDKHTGPAAGPGILSLLDQVEATAVSIYRSHGLPTRPGHYAWSRRSKGWRFLAEDLTSEERWALILDNPYPGGSRFGLLEDLGTADPAASSSLRDASHLLIECRALRAALIGDVGRPSADDLARAIRLGANWSRLEATLALAYTGQLKLTVDEETIERLR